jgi:hypothetical protein
MLFPIDTTLTWPVLAKTKERELINVQEVAISEVDQTMLGGMEIIDP